MSYLIGTLGKFYTHLTCGRLNITPETIAVKIPHWSFQLLKYTHTFGLMHLNTPTEYSTMLNMHTHTQYNGKISHARLFSCQTYTQLIFCQLNITLCVCVSFLWSWHWESNFQQLEAIFTCDAWPAKVHTTIKVPSNSHFLQINNVYSLFLLKV